MFFIVVFLQHVIQQHRALLYMPPQSPAYSLKYHGSLLLHITQVSSIVQSVRSNSWHPLRLWQNPVSLGTVINKNQYHAVDTYYVTLHGWLPGAMPDQRENWDFLRHLSSIYPQLTLTSRELFLIYNQGNILPSLQTRKKLELPRDSTTWLLVLQS